MAQHLRGMLFTEEGPGQLLPPVRHVNGAKQKRMNKLELHKLEKKKHVNLISISMNEMNEISHHTNNLNQTTIKPY